jgi:S1-C subfamily serine protease
VRRQTLILLSATVLLAQSPSESPAGHWVTGEIAYRVTIIPDGSAAARIGLRIGDVLAEPAALPGLLRESSAEGVQIPLFRLEEGRYRRTKLKLAFRAGEEKRLGVTGDLGFLVTAVEPGSLGARADLRSGDFIPKINETFVHSVEDLKLVDQAYAKSAPVEIHYTRWLPETNSFQDAVAQPRFQK